MSLVLLNYCKENHLLDLVSKSFAYTYCGLLLGKLIKYNKIGFTPTNSKISTNCCKDCLRLYEIENSFRKKPFLVGRDASSINIKKPPNQKYNIILKMKYFYNDKNNGIINGK